MMQRVPAPSMARVASFNMLGAFAFGPVAFVAAGPAAAAFGARAVLGFGAAWAAFGTLAVLAVPAVRAVTWQDTAAEQDGDGGEERLVGADGERAGRDPG